MKILKLIVLSLMVAACSSSPQSRYYALSEAKPSATPTPATAEWSLDKAAVPELINRPQVVHKSGANGIDLLEYDRWAEPLDAAVTRILTADITDRKLPYVQVLPPAGMNPPVPPPPQPDKKHVTVTISDFGADEGGLVTLKATWTVETGSITMQHDFAQTQNAAGGVTSEAAAMSALLGALSDAIAAQL